MVVVCACDTLKNPVCPLNTSPCVPAARALLDNFRYQAHMYDALCFSRHIGRLVKCACSFADIVWYSTFAPKGLIGPLSCASKSAVHVEYSNLIRDLGYCVNSNNIHRFSHHRSSSPDCRRMADVPSLTLLTPCGRGSSAISDV